MLDGTEKIHGWLTVEVQVGSHQSRKGKRGERIITVLLSVRGHTKRASDVKKKKEHAQNNKADSNNQQKTKEFNVMKRDRNSIKLPIVELVISKDIGRYD